MHSALVVCEGLLTNLHFMMTNDNAADSIIFTNLLTG